MADDVQDQPQLTGTYLDDLPSEMRPQQSQAPSPPWEPTGTYLDDLPPELRPHPQQVKQRLQQDMLQSQRDKLADKQETMGSYILRRWTPGGATAMQVKQDLAYSASLKKFQGGTANPDDAKVIAAYEKTKQLDEQQNQTFRGKALSALQGATVMGGEMLATGPVLKMAGLGISAGAKVSVPLYTGRLLTQTALMPSLYAKQLTDANMERGRHPLDPTGLPAAYGVALVQNALLGQLSNQAKIFQGPGLGNLIGRLGTKGAIGAGEQAGADVATGFLQDQVRKVLPSWTRKETHYGTLGDLASGKYGEAAQNAVIQAITFGVFGGLHELTEGTPNQRKQWEAARQEGMRRGLSEYAAEAQAHALMMGQASANAGPQEPAAPIPGGMPSPQATRQPAPVLPKLREGLAIGGLPSSDRMPPGMPQIGMANAGAVGPYTGQQVRPEPGPRPAEPVVPSPVLKAFADLFNEDHSKGFEIGVPTAKAQEVANRVARALQDNPNLSREQVRALFGDMKGKQQALGHAVADAFPASLENKVPSPPGPAAPPGPPPAPTTPPGTQGGPTAPPAPTTPPGAAPGPGEPLPAPGDRPAPLGPPGTGGAILPGGKPGMPAARPENEPTVTPEGLKAPDLKSLESGAAPETSLNPVQRRVLEVVGNSREGSMTEILDILNEGKEPEQEMRKVQLREHLDALLDAGIIHQEVAPNGKKVYVRTIKDEAPGSAQLQEIFDKAKLSPVQQSELKDFHEGLTQEEIGAKRGVGRAAVSLSMGNAIAKMEALGGDLPDSMRELKARMQEQNKPEVKNVSAEELSHTQQTAEESSGVRAGELNKLEDQLNALAKKVAKQGGKWTEADRRRHEQLSAAVEGEGSSAERRAAKKGGPAATPPPSPPGTDTGVRSPEQAARAGKQFGEPLSEEERKVTGGGGQPVEGEEIPQERKTTLGKEQVGIEREQRKAGPLPERETRSDELVKAEAEARLQDNPQAGFDLVRDLEKKPRPTTDVEGAILLQHRVQLFNHAARMETQAIEAHKQARAAGNTGTFTPEILEKQRAAEDALSAIDHFEHVMDKAKSEAGAGFRWLNVLMAEDYTLHGMRRRLEFLKQGEPLTEAEKSQVADLQKKLKELQDKLDAQKKGGVTGKPAEDAQVEMVKTRRQWRKLQEAVKDTTLSPVQKVFRNVIGAFDVSRAIMTAFDLSAVLRQGAILTFAHPIKAFKAFPEMIRAFRSQDAADRSMNQINNRDNAMNYRRDGLYLADPDAGLSGQEEAFIGRWVKKIPGLAGSERAYNTYLNRMRADVYDSMTASLPREGRASQNEGKAIANFINIATGRGSLGALENSAVTMSRLFFSPRFVASRFQFLAGQPMWGGTGATRGAIAKEYGRALLGLGAFYAMMALGDDKAKFTWDPRSSDFGKVVMGNTHLDPLAGLAQEAVFGTRLVSGQTKSTTSGNVSDLRGEMVPRGGQTVMDVISRFVRSKLAPLPGGAVNLLSGENVVGGKVSVASQAGELVTPMAIKDVWQAMADQGAAKGTIAGLLTILGMGSQVYEPRSLAAKDRPQVVHDYQVQLQHLSSLRSNSPERLAGKRFPQEREYQKLEAVAGTMNELNALLKRPNLSEERRAAIRKRQAEIAKRVLAVP